MEESRNVSEWLMPRQPTAHLGLEGERSAFEATARALYRYLEPEYARVELSLTSVGSVTTAVVTLFRSDGDAQYVSRPSEVTARARELRAAMYQEDAGTWFSVNMAVTAEREVDARYNYDDEPEWDWPQPPEVYAADLRDFPRDAQHTPEWLRAKVTAASA